MELPPDLQDGFQSDPIDWPEELMKWPGKAHYALIL